MIKHIVCFKLDDNSPAFCQETKDLLMSMASKVPMLLDIKVGIDFLHSNRSYDIILETYFKNQADLDLYQNDPYHCSVVKTHMHKHATSSIAVDYEIPDFTYEVLDHQMGVDLWPSKNALFKAFFGEFYEFIKSHNGQSDLDLHNIKNKEDFYQLADWNAEGKDSCYAMGFAFHKYYLTDMEAGTLDLQDENSFIGYLHHHQKFTNFLNFLITFFAWWRNDEGCTRFDPYNHGDEFFNSSWAALVDTCKLFYLSSETVYHWQSFRVKYALDHIPGVILKQPTSINDCLQVAGYEFLGFKEQDGKIVAEIKPKDTYNYWEKEEKTIKKVYVKDYKKVDPA